MFTPISGKIVAEIVSSGLLKKNPSVVELGNQTYDIDNETLSEIIKLFEINKRYENFNIKISLLGSFLGKKTRQADSPLVRDFFLALGFKTYVSIDINGKYDSLAMDLNYPIDTYYDFYERFDLVTNIGVSEHLFDQKNFFRNMHHLVAVDGILFCMLPFSNYINHCFYNYHPVFFEDLANANNYTILDIFLSERDRKVLDLTKPNIVSTYFYPYINSLAKNFRKNIFLVVVMRKESEADFVVPLQGKYMGDIVANGLGGNYQLQRAQVKRPAMGFYSEESFLLDNMQKRYSVRIRLSLLSYLKRISEMLITNK